MAKFVLGPPHFQGPVAPIVDDKHILFRNGRPARQPRVLCLQLNFSTITEAGDHSVHGSEYKLTAVSPSGLDRSLAAVVEIVVVQTAQKRLDCSLNARVEVVIPQIEVHEGRVDLQRCCNLLAAVIADVVAPQIEVSEGRVDLQRCSDCLAALRADLVVTQIEFRNTA